jgi:hypothetical protein
LAVTSVPEQLHQFLLTTGITKQYARFKASNSKGDEKVVSVLKVPQGVIDHLNA